MPCSRCKSSHRSAWRLSPRERFLCPARVQRGRKSSVCGVTLRSYAADLFDLYEKCLVLGRLRIGIVARRRDQIHKSARGAPRIFSNPAETPTEGNSYLVDTFSVHLERPKPLGDHRPANVSAPGSGDAHGIAG